MVSGKLWESIMRVNQNNLKERIARAQTASKRQRQKEMVATKILEILIDYPEVTKYYDRGAFIDLAGHCFFDKKLFDAGLKQAKNTLNQDHPNLEWISPVCGLAAKYADYKGMTRRWR